MIKPGIYRHYKGKLYQVNSLAIHSETLESFVVYKPLYGDEKMWIRPEKMFNAEVEVEGKRMKRFEFIEN